ncbi:MAG: hypothetical protein ACR2ID_11330 [Chthoniobacterales bacterium]
MPGVGANIKDRPEALETKRSLEINIHVRSMGYFLAVYFTAKDGLKECLYEMLHDLRKVLLRNIRQWMRSVPVRKITLSFFVIGCALTASSATAITAESLIVQTAIRLSGIGPARLFQPQSWSSTRKTDSRLDPKLRRAATIADERAHSHSKSRCWRSVKQALLASGAISSYRKTALAKQALLGVYGKL